MTEPVLLFDGECGLCNLMTRFLLRHDHSTRLRFATLQGPYGQAALRKRGLPAEDFDSVVFLPLGDEGPALVRTDGALSALAQLGGNWAQVARVLQKIPSPARDLVYRMIARVRYRIWGRYRGAPLAESPAWAERFLT